MSRIGNGLRALGEAGSAIVRAGGEVVNAIRLGDELDQAIEHGRYTATLSLTTLDRMRGLVDSFPGELRNVLRDYNCDSVVIPGISTENCLTISNEEPNYFDTEDGRRYVMPNPMLVISLTSEYDPNEGLQYHVRNDLGVFFYEIFGGDFYFFVLYLIANKLFPTRPTDSQWGRPTKLHPISLVKSSFSALCAILCR